MTDMIRIKVENGPEDLVEIVTLPVEYSVISGVLMDSLLRYMLWGDKRFGDFIRMCLLNDLQRAFARWDGVDWQEFYMIVKFIYNRLPSRAWGTHGKVDTWKGTFYVETHTLEELQEGTSPVN